MKTAFFLIPTSHTAKGLPLDYQLTEHPVDRRTRFWRFNSERIVSAETAVSVAEKIGMQLFRDDAGAVCRILAPDGKKAYAYHAAMAKAGYEAYRKGVI
jgi:hypothetical protein